MNQPFESPPSPTTAPTAGSGDNPDPFGLADLIAAGYLDVMPGQPPVPITRWRIADVASRARDGLTTRTALLLVAFYTRTGHTIVSLGDDPALAGVAGAAGCRYISVDDPTDLTELDHVAGTVGLFVLRWPPERGLSGHGTAFTADMVAGLFTACRRLSAPDGYTVVALTLAGTGPDYVEHVRLLAPAARRAGLGWLQHIVAVTSPLGERQLAGRPERPQPELAGAASEPTVNVELLVFVIRGYPANPEQGGARHRQTAMGRQVHRRGRVASGGAA